MATSIRYGLYLLSLLVLLFGVAACGSEGESSAVGEMLGLEVDTPETAAREWLGAMIDADGAALMERTCPQERETVQNLGLFRSLVGIAGEEVAGDKGSGSIDGLKLDVLANDGQAATLRVHGEVISSLLAVGVTQEIDETWVMINEGGMWKYCGIVGADIAVTGTDEAAPSLVHDWTIPTGDIDFLTVAEDGTIYGLIRSVTPYRHVTISPTGEVIKVVELEESEINIAQATLRGSNVKTMTDGTFIIGNKHPMLLFPDGTYSYFTVPEFVNNTMDLDISDFGDGHAALVVDREKHAELLGVAPETFIFYSIDKNNGPVTMNSVRLPDSSAYELLDVGGDFYGSKPTSFVAYRDKDNETFVLINGDGETVYNDHPEGLDMSRYTNYDYYLAPWGDLWLTYNKIDQIGADKGLAVLRVDLTGTVTPFAEPAMEPYQLKRIQYLPNRDEIYFVGVDDNYLGLMDRDLNLLKSYSYPEETYLGGRFVGFDANFYTWNERENLLSKYTIPE